MCTNQTCAEANAEVIRNSLPLCPGVGGGRWRRPGGGVESPKVGVCSAVTPSGIGRVLEIKGHLMGLYKTVCR